MTPSFIVLGVHGLPQPPAEPFSQLDPVRTALRTLPRVTDHDPHFCWCAGSLQALRHSLTLLEEGRFGQTFVPALQSAARGVTIPPDSFFVVVAFSAGGYLVYRWPLEQNESTERIAAVTIAAPYRNEAHAFRLKPDQRRPFPFHDRNLAPSAIAARLQPGRLLVLLAESDATVLRDEAAFDADDRGAELIAAGMVAQHVVKGTDHASICSASETHMQIVRHLNRLARR